MPDARQLVQSIAKKHGFLGEDVYSRMEPDVRRQVEEAMLNKDEMIGSSVITLSKNLYNSSARFVFELLQNADDNSYSRAKASSADPYVSFHVYIHRIVVECNEDGFTHENLVAICNVGKSSKSGAQGYIGEKGIGFKSVFMVAWKVLIQSGDFSFYFQHKKGDSGMGMISPVWQDVESDSDDDDATAGPLTRITLFLHDSMLDDAMETTRLQFQEIESTFLLFMKNLRRIDVAMYDENDEQTIFTRYSIEHQSENRVELETEVSKNDEIETHSKKYHLTKHIAKGLPKSENRNYTPDEISRRAFQTAEFLIQTDFVTDASRQDIVRSSARNIGLLDGIAETFVKAVSQFCEHPALRYTWMRYLPQKDDYPWDKFWSSLLKKIESELEGTPVLWTRSHSNLRPIEAMRRLDYKMLDHTDNPLLPDSVPEQYLAAEYSYADLNRLIEYGRRTMSKSEFLNKLKWDLDNHSSKVKSIYTDEEWHARLADCLMSMLPTYRTAIERLNLIPLIGGEWVSAKYTTICYSQAHNKYPIPTDLGLKLVHSRAEKTTQRKELFDALGVKNANIMDIRKLIFDKYHYSSFSVRDLATSRSHLNFLYLTTHLAHKKDNMNYSRMHILDQEHRCKRSDATHPVYFVDDKSYGAKELFRIVNTDTDSNDAAPGLDVSFIHHEYMEDPPKQPEGERQSWEIWLRDTLGIYDFIPLFTKGEALNDPYHLSKECLYVSKHRPKKFLGFLLENWRQTDNQTIIKHPNLIEELLKLEVLCESGRKHPLGKTYLPIAAHQEARRFFEDEEFFPWLHIEASLRDNDTKFSELQALAKKLSFGFPKSEVEFFLDILRYIKSANEDASKLTRETRVYDLYGRIEARYRESVDQEACRDLIKKAFMSFLTYAPAFGNIEPDWCYYEDCRWDAPTPMSYWTCLKWHYENVADIVPLKSLFHGILEVPNVGPLDFGDELVELAESDEPSSCFNDIYRAYRNLQDMIPQMTDTERNHIRDYMERCGLVYHVNNNEANPKYWYSPRDCLWSVTTEIKGMRNISNLYEDLFVFFVDFLEVPTLTLEMVVDKLIEQGKDEGTSVEEIKETIWQVNAFLQSDQDHPNSSQVLNGNVFPIRNPNNGDFVELRSSKTDFVIADREPLLKLFSDRAKRLDFNVNEIHRLEPFLRWMDLENRYLSRSVKEITALGNDDSSKHLMSSDRDIALKAHGLLRIAVHFRSPRARNGEQLFYDELKKIKVYETDGITSQLHLSQDNKIIIVELSKSEIHLQDHEDGLRIYVPQDEDLQYQCFLDRIHEALLEWIMTDPSTGICEDFNDKAVHAMQSVIHAQPKYISTTLDRSGIVSIDIPDDSMMVQPDDKTPAPPGPDEEHIPQGSHDDSDWEMDTLVQDNTQHTVPPTRPVDTSDADDAEDNRVTSARAAHRSASPIVNPITYTPRQGAASVRISLSPEIADPVVVDYEYLRILRSAVIFARRAVFPSRGTFDMAALFDSLPTEADTDNPGEYFGLRSSEKIERDKKIGAAGELFVFEILSRLTPVLPGFSRDNWQSTIRHYVSIHDEYADLTPWVGRETADITYHDSDGILTNLLVDKGYLAASPWLGRRPRYFLEVKATTGDCDSAFYMSKHQYARMQTYSNGDSGYEQLNYIYVIFRVFNVGKESIDMKVYVDPEVMRTRNELKFKAETWSVVPAPS
ncbi:hypothetical protein ZTR_07715 [Talaromyces verruculosus]|nr:hypothetical protein ZTR_07715 [Talaromyces verruculosus]